MRDNRTMCAQLRALLASESDGTNVAQLESTVEQHIMTCAACAECEQALTLLLTGYRHLEPSLNEAVELRLLEHICHETTNDRHTQP